MNIVITQTPTPVIKVIMQDMTTALLATIAAMQGSNGAFSVVSFAAEMNLDASTNRNFIITVTNNCTINLINATDGMEGTIEILLSGNYSVTLGTGFDKLLSGALINTSGSDNIVRWQRIGSSGVYSISQAASALMDSESVSMDNESVTMDSE